MAAIFALSTVRSLTIVNHVPSHFSLCPASLPSPVDSLSMNLNSANCCHHLESPPCMLCHKGLRSAFSFLKIYCMRSPLPNSSPPIISYKKHLQSLFLPCIKKGKYRASLVAQWLRVCLPKQGTWVRALVWEDPTCRGATKPVSHNYWACASRVRAPQQERPRQWEARAPRWRVAPARRN